MLYAVATLLRRLHQAETPAAWPGFLLGGDMGSRTPDLFIANESLYQLSYVPVRGRAYKAPPAAVQRQALAAGATRFSSGM